eukprot:6181898-Pleurochrysis_carterae.AAC.5
MVSSRAHHIAYHFVLNPPQTHVSLRLMLLSRLVVLKDDSRLERSSELEFFVSSFATSARTIYHARSQGKWRRQCQKSSH